MGKQEWTLSKFHLHKNMKFLFLFSLLLLTFQLSTAFAGNGSFLVRKSTYFYLNKNKTGKKILTRKRMAYAVTGIGFSKEKHLMLQILVPVKSNIINGSGFISETDNELQKLGFSKVKVYTRVPRLNNKQIDYQPVPSNQLSFTGGRETSPDFPNLTWRAVNYKTNVPEKYWIPEWSGIYRPDKGADWLNNTYQRAKKKKPAADLMNKILMGLVEIGFTREQVRMTLGTPVTEQFIENNTKTEWIYQSRKIIFENNRVLRVL